MSVDAALLTLVALADLAFLAYLRRRHRRQMRRERVAESLRHFVRRECLNVRHQKIPIHEVPNFPRVVPAANVIFP